ncbi:MAG: hypothetical protein HQL31_13785 [Planctomycetes bacterium]|nr:hypothetical protein [Planctomycetota bacterium]
MNASIQSALASILLLANSGPALFAESTPLPPAIVSIPRTEKVPEIDGRFKKEECATTKISDFYHNKVDLFDRRGGSIYLARSDDYLYVAIVTPVHPRHGPLVRYRRAYPGGDMGKIVHDDSLELWLAPGSDDRNGKAYQIIFSSNGASGSQCHEIAHEVSRPWLSKGLRYGNSIDGNNWTLELALPLKDICLEKGADGMHLRICRNYQMPFVQARTTPGVHAYKDPATMLKLVFASAPLVTEPEWTSIKGEMASVDICNPTEQTMSLKIAGESIDMAPMTSRQIPVQIHALTEDQRETRLEIKDEEGRWIHRRCARWQLSDQPLWEEVL